MLIPSRREVLKNLGPSRSTHPGLWLDKYLWTPDKGDSTAKRDLVKDVITLAKSNKIKTAYENHFRRYQTALTNRSSPVYTATGKTQGRLSVGLGANAVLETSITLHRTYGVPYIPGSALKGLASSYAAKHLKHEAWRRAFEGGKTIRGELQRLIFGDTEESGLVVFYDALPDPNDYQLYPDVVTVHHPEYYQGKGKPPADWDSPIPIPFITAQGMFHFFLGLVPLPKGELESGRKVLEVAARLLKKALEEEGVGAKTTIGYGRIAATEFAPLEPPEPERSDAYKRAERLANGMKYQETPQKMKEIARIWSDLPPEEKSALLMFLREKKPVEIKHTDLSPKSKGVKKDPHLKNLVAALKDV